MKLLFAPGFRFGFAAPALVVIAVSGVASASSTLHLPGVELVVEDAYGRDCGTPGGASACLGRYEPGSPETLGDDVISLDTGPARASAELRPGEIPVAGEVLAGALPQDSHSVRFDEVGVELPLFPAYGKLRGHAGSLPTDSVAGADVSEERMTWWHLWLQPSRTDRGVYTQAYTNPWNDSTGLFNYTHFRYPGQVANGSSDDAFPFLEGLACVYARNFSGWACEKLPLAELNDSLRARAPEVRTGLDAEELSVRTNPANGGPGSWTNASTSPSGRDGSARDGLDPAPFLPRGAPVPGALAVTSIPVGDDDPPPAGGGAPGVSQARSSAGMDRPVPRPAGALVATAVVSLLAFLAATLYQRVARSRIPDQPMRRALLDLVAEEPGVSFTAAARRLGIDLTTVVYHARLLAKAGYLVVRESGVKNERQLLLPGACDAQGRARDLKRLLDHPVARAIAMKLAREGVIPRGIVRGSIGVPVSTFNWHVQRLRDAGVVEARGRAAIALSPEASAATVAALLGESPRDPAGLLPAASP